jgi:nitrate/nitrite transporter NarK
MTTVLVALDFPGGTAVRVTLLLAGFIFYNLLTNAGPNATTFTLAPELFPTQLRGTASGFASAAAKLGATIGVFALPPLRSAVGIAGVIVSMVGVTLLGLALTVVFAHEVHGAGHLEDEHRRASPSFPGRLRAASDGRRTPTHA